MRDLSNKVAVITGAGSGIGRALAYGLAAEGCQLALSDIDTEGLQETVTNLSVSQDKILHAKLDVSNKNDFAAHADDVITKFGEVDIVINNAGISSVGNFDEIPYAVIEKVLSVNLWSVINGSYCFLPHLKKQSEASLVNIASINSMFPFYSCTPYSMAKYAVLGLNETLMMELKGTPVQILSVHPGGIKTNIANSGLGQNEEGKKAFNDFAMTTPEKCAAQIIKGIKNKKSRIFVGPDAKFWQITKRVSPKLALWMSYRLTGPQATLNKTK